MEILYITSMNFDVCYFNKNIHVSVAILIFQQIYNYRFKKTHAVVSIFYPIILTLDSTLSRPGEGLFLARE